MDSPEEEKEPLFAEFRKAFQEGLASFIRINRRVSDSEWCELLADLIWPKWFACELTLLFAGEQDGRSVAKDTMFRANPIKPLLQMLDGMCTLEPRIKHPVWKDVI